MESSGCQEVPMYTRKNSTSGDIGIHFMKLQVKPLACWIIRCWIWINNCFFKHVSSLRWRCRLNLPRWKTVYRVSCLVNISIAADMATQWAKALTAMGYGIFRFHHQTELKNKIWIHEKNRCYLSQARREWFDFITQMDTGLVWYYLLWYSIVYYVSHRQVTQWP